MASCYKRREEVPPLASRDRARISSGRCIAKLRARIISLEESLSAYQQWCGEIPFQPCSEAHGSPPSSDFEIETSLASAIGCAARQWLETLIRFQFQSFNFWQQATCQQALPT